MIDVAIRSRGIGGSEIAAILGLDPRRDAFSVYADKLGLVQRQEPNERMVAGKFLEQGIARWYAARTRQRVEWCDETTHHPDREWQVWTPDALVYNPAGRRIGGLDAKNVAWDQQEKWGDPGTDQVPDPIHLQCQWYCSGEDLPWWDVGACFGGNDLRVYRVNRDVEIEAVILEEAEKFWHQNVLARVPPPAGPSPATVEALKQMYPSNAQKLRFATPAEGELLSQLKIVGEEWEEVNKRYLAIENQVKVAIGDAEGLMHGAAKVTWKKEKDSTGTDWDAIAHELALRLGLIQQKVGIQNWPLEWCETVDQMAVAKQFQRITRHGARKMNVHWGKKKL